MSDLQAIFAAALFFFLVFTTNQWVESEERATRRHAAVMEVCRGN